MKILMVLTSHDQLGDSGVKTGFGWKSLPPLTMFFTMRAPTHAGITSRWAASTRPQKRGGRCPNPGNSAF